VSGAAPGVAGGESQCGTTDGGAAVDEQRLAGDERGILGHKMVSSLPTVVARAALPRFDRWRYSVSFINASDGSVADVSRLIDGSG
jgi:hypothetical protein